MDVEGNYLVLLARDSYDVPYRSRDGEKQDDASSEVYTYILCSVCPVKAHPARTELLCPPERVSQPEGRLGGVRPQLGFLFPRL